MSAQVWTLIADELMNQQPEWERAGLHVVEPGPYEHPGVRWWKLQDDGAPETLEGKRIEYIIESLDGEPRVAGRRPA